MPRFDAFSLMFCRRHFTHAAHAFATRYASFASPYAASRRFIDAADYADAADAVFLRHTPYDIPVFATTVSSLFHFFAVLMSP